MVTTGKEVDIKDFKCKDTEGYLGFISGVGITLSFEADVLYADDITVNSTKQGHFKTTKQYTMKSSL
jgi:hypothetical protein